MFVQPSSSSPAPPVAASPDKSAAPLVPTSQGLTRLFELGRGIAVAGLVLPFNNPLTDLLLDSLPTALLVCYYAEFVLRTRMHVPSVFARAVVVGIGLVLVGVVVSATRRMRRRADATVRSEASATRSAAAELRRAPWWLVGVLVRGACIWWGLVIAPRSMNVAVGLRLVASGVSPEWVTLRRPWVWLGAVAVFAIVFLAADRRWEPSLTLRGVAAMGAAVVLIRGSSRAWRRRITWSSVLPPVSTFAAIVGLALGYGFASSFFGWSPSPGSLPRLGDGVDVYDVAFVPGTDRVYFSSKTGPPGFVELHHGMSHTSAAPLTRSERMTFVPSRNRFFVGGDTVAAFSIDQAEYQGDVFPSRAADVQAVDDHLLYILPDSIPSTDPVLFVHDLDSGATRTLPAPFLTSHKIVHDASRGAIFVSTPIGLPVLSRYDLQSGAIRRARVGYMSLDMELVDEGRKLLVARPMYSRVDVRDSASLALIRSITIDPMVREIGCSEADGWLFTLEYFHGDLKVLDLSTGRALFDARIGRLARALAYSRERGLLVAGSAFGLFEFDLRALVGRTERGAG